MVQDCTRNYILFWSGRERGIMVQVQDCTRSNISFSKVRKKKSRFRIALREKSFLVRCRKSFLVQDCTKSNTISSQVEKEESWLRSNISFSNVQKEKIMVQDRTRSNFFFGQSLALQYMQRTEYCSQTLIILSLQADVVTFDI